MMGNVQSFYRINCILVIDLKKIRLNPVLLGNLCLCVFNFTQNNFFSISGFGTVGTLIP